MKLKFLSLFAAAALLAACAGDGGTGGDTTSGGAGSGGSGGGQTASTPSGADINQDFVVNVGDRVFFELDSSALSETAQGVLRRQAEFLQRFPSLTVTVEGHCDERGTREYNLALGERRANAVKDYLVALGVSPNRVATISYGKERPAVLGTGEDVWGQNRRSVTVPNS